MDYQLIPLAHEHLGQAAEIERLCFSDPWSEKMLAEHLANPCSLTLAAVDGAGRLLGYVGLLAVSAGLRGASGGGGRGVHHQRGGPSGLPPPGGRLVPAPSPGSPRQSEKSDLPHPGGPAVQRPRPGPL